MQLETDRLILRDFLENDWKEVLIYQNDFRYLQYYEWTSRTPEDVIQFVKDFILQQEAIPRRKFQFALILKNSGKLIGNCGIRINDENNVEADIGCELNPEYWNNGYAIESVKEIVGFGVRDLGVKKITASCIAENTASQKLISKIGMKIEKKLPEKSFFKGRTWDELVFGIDTSELADKI